MTKDMMLMRIAAILTALAETNGTPESMLYIFCEMDMQAYETIRDILVRAKYVTIKGNYVTLTNNGKEMAQKIEAQMAANKAAKSI